MKGPELHLRPPVYIVWILKCPAAMKYCTNSDSHRDQSSLSSSPMLRGETLLVPVRMEKTEIIPDLLI